MKLLIIGISGGTVGVLEKVPFGGGSMELHTANKIGTEE